MNGERYVLLGLGSSRDEWFRQLAQWSNSASIDADFIKCLSVAELRARLSSNRAFSAILVDSASAGLDRDLIDLAHAEQCRVFVVAGKRSGADWAQIGADAVLPPTFSVSQLLEQLQRQGRRVPTGDRIVTLREEPAPTWRGRVVSVFGSGGTGVSTISIAVAQGLAADPRRSGLVVLADMALRAEQSILHDVDPLASGIQELVEANRTGRLTGSQIRELTLFVRERNYYLLLGLRRPYAWPVLRSMAFRSAFEGLSQAFKTVVCDVDPNLEGQEDSGSADIEDRHLMARTSVLAADIVIVVGLPGVKGTHSLIRSVNELLTRGVEPVRILAVVNRAPKSPLLRAEIKSAVLDLVNASKAEIASPLFLTERHIDSALRDGVRLPKAFVQPVTTAVEQMLSHVPPRTIPANGPLRIAAGSLGSWTEENA